MRESDPRAGAADPHSPQRQGRFGGGPLQRTGQGEGLTGQSEGVAMRGLEGVMGTSGSKLE